MRSSSPTNPSHNMLPLKPPSPSLFLAKWEMRASQTFQDAPYVNARTPTHYSTFRARIDRTTNYCDFNPSTWPTKVPECRVPKLSMAAMSATEPDNAQENTVSRGITQGQLAAHQSSRIDSARPATSRPTSAPRPHTARHEEVTADREESIDEKVARWAPAATLVSTAHGGAQTDRPIPRRLRQSQKRPLTVDSTRVGLGGLRWEKQEWLWGAEMRQHSSQSVPVHSATRSVAKVYPNTRDFGTDSIYSTERRAEDPRPKTRSTGRWEVPPMVQWRREVASGALGGWVGGRQVERPSTAGIRMVPYNYHWDVRADTQQSRGRVSSDTQQSRARVSSARTRPQSARAAKTKTAWG